MKKNKNQQQKRKRHPIQHNQQFTPVRVGGQSNTEHRYGNRSPSHYPAASPFPHSRNKNQMIQQYYQTPSLSTDQAATSSTSSNRSDGRFSDSTILAQVNPAIAYTMDHLQPGGVDLFQCKLIDSMFDVDEDYNVQDEFALLTPQQQEAMHPQRARSTIPEETISPQDYCAQHHVPAHALFSLSNISSLGQYIGPGSVVIFDIDDTLVKRQYNDSSLLSQLGTNMFHIYLQSQACQYMSYDEKQSLVKELGNALKQFVLAEPDTAQVVENLQKNGCYVFCLTARSSSMSTVTSQCLTSLGIDLKNSLPPAMPSHAIEPQTGAAVIDGVIYCNDIPKGLVFQRFFAQQWISFPVLHHCHDVTCKNDPQCTKASTIVTSTSKQPAHHKALECPERPVWFIDDSYVMLQNMIQQWQGHAEKQLEFYSSLSPQLQQQMPCAGRLALVCCHYTHPSNYTLNPAANPAQIPSQATLEKVIAIQISHFVKSQKILTDSEALSILGPAQ